jgi:hypothetical protein
MLTFKLSRVPQVWPPGHWTSQLSSRFSAYQPLKVANTLALMWVPHLFCKNDRLSIGPLWQDTRNISKVLIELARLGMCLLPNSTVRPNRRWAWMGKEGQILEEAIKLWSLALWVIFRNSPMWCCNMYMCIYAIWKIRHILLVCIRPECLTSDEAMKKILVGKTTKVTRRSQISSGFNDEAFTIFKWEQNEILLVLSMNQGAGIVSKL